MNIAEFSNLTGQHFLLYDHESQTFTDVLGELLGDQLICPVSAYPI